MVWLQIFLFYDSKPAICGHFLARAKFKFWVKNQGMV